MAIHFESGDQPMLGAQVNALDQKSLGSSEKSLPTVALVTLLMPRMSELHLNATFFPLGDHGSASALAVHAPSGMSALMLRSPASKVPSDKRVRAILTKTSASWFGLREKVSWFSLVKPAAVGEAKDKSHHAVPSRAVVTPN